MNRSAMKRALAMVIGVVASSPALALACPQCAGRADGGTARGVLLGAFILFPFALVWTVWRILRAETATAGGHSESGS
jgi:hypothetical protein